MQNVLKIGNITWTHLNAPTKDEIIKLGEKYDFHELIIDDLLEFNTQEKVDVYDNYIFLILNFPKYNTITKKYVLNEFDMILGKDSIITITRFETNHIEKIRSEYSKEIKEEGSEQYKISPYYILYKIFDTMFDKALKTLNNFTKDVVILEEKLFSNEKLQKNILEDLMIKKRNMVFLKHLFLPHREILTEIQGVIDKFYGELDVYFEDIAYKIDKIINNIDIMYENVSSLTETYNSLMNIKTNSVINILTIFSVITGLLTLISGIYGMNIILPYQSYELFYVYLLIFMLILSSFLVFIFKKKGWI